VTQIPTESRIISDPASLPPAPKGVLDAYFKISARGSTIGAEIRGGLTTFMAMAYIIVLNPILLSGADITGHHLNPGQITTATALAAAVTTIALGLTGNVPLAAAPRPERNAVPPHRPSRRMGQLPPPAYLITAHPRARRVGNRAISRHNPLGGRRGPIPPHDRPPAGAAATPT